MVGYVTSADNSGDVTNPQITVIFTEDFYNGFEDMPKAVYTYNRNTNKFAETATEYCGCTVSSAYLLEAVELLELEEVRHNLAMKVFWKGGFSQGITHIRSEYLDGVWFPSPILADGCKENCVNITEFIYSKTPCTLETSFMCDVLNILCALGHVGISAPFYCCYNSIFLDASFLKIVCDVFGEDDFYENVSSDVRIMLTSLHSFGKRHKTDVSKIKKKLEDIKYEEKEYSGTRHEFAINVKRNCQNGVLAHINRALDGDETLKEFVESVREEVDSAIKRFSTLAELFHVTGNLDRVEDIRFLTLYEMMSAFAFGENEITLKASVRRGRERITHINKTQIPEVIYKDGRYK